MICVLAFTQRVPSDGFLLLRELLLSASQGNADSMVELGHCYLTGAISCGVGMDIDLAISWYSKAGTHGQPIASIYMGFIHHFGLGVEGNNFRSFLVSIVLLYFCASSEYSSGRALLRISPPEP